jgi:hypothetical protein
MICFHWSNLPFYSYKGTAMPSGDQASIQILLLERETEQNLRPAHDLFFPSEFDEGDNDSNAEEPENPPSCVVRLRNVCEVRFVI